MPADDTKITPEEAAGILGMSLPLVRRRIDVGVLPSRRVGASCRIRLADVLALRAREQPMRAALEALAADTETLERTLALPAEVSTPRACSSAAMARRLLAPSACAWRTTASTSPARSITWRLRAAHAAAAISAAAGVGEGLPRRTPRALATAKAARVRWLINPASSSATRSSWKRRAVNGSAATSNRIYKPPESAASDSSSIRRHGVRTRIGGTDWATRPQCSSTSTVNRLP